MPRATPLLAVLTVLLAALPSGNAISCYKCTDTPTIKIVGDGSLGDKLAGGLNNFLKSVTDKVGMPPCTEFQTNEDRFRHENCPPGNSCVKVVVDGKTARSCSPSTGKDECQVSEGGTSCSCSTDYCNAAVRGAPALPLLLLLPAALLALLNSQL